MEQGFTIKKIGRLYFDTYNSLNKTDKALEYGFKYLLNVGTYSKSIIELLDKKYGKEKYYLRTIS